MQQQDSPPEQASSDEQAQPVQSNAGRPTCPDCGGPVGILAPSEANFEEFPPGWDALFIIICNPLSGPISFLTQPWYCRKCNKPIPKEQIPEEFRSRRRQVGCSFLGVGLLVVVIVIILIAVLGD